jgi:hypothetical protein
VHHLIRVIRDRVSHYRDIVAKLGRVSDGGLDAGVRDQPNDDELLYAVLLELQVKIGVRKTAGAPMLAGDNLARRWHEFGTELAALCAVFEGLPVPCCLLNGRIVLPCLIIPRMISMMHGLENPQLRPTRGYPDVSGGLIALPALPRVVQLRRYV